MNQMVTTHDNLPALPAHMRKAPGAGANQDVGSGLATPFIVPPKLSIEGKVFRVIKDDQTIPITRKDEDGNVVPVSSLNVVVVSANRGKYKVFYGTKYDPKAEAEAPKCYSYDGERPSPNASNPQNATCMGCPQNEFGSMVNDLGNETRACSDGKLLAVIPLVVVKAMLPATAKGADIYSLKVAATSLSRNKKDRKEFPANTTSLIEYVGILNAFPAEGGAVELPMREVATNLHFDINAKYPRLQFKLAAQPWLTEEQIEYVAKRAEGDDVQAIIAEQGQGPAPVRPPVTAERPKPTLVKPPVDEDDVLIGEAAVGIKPPAQAAPADGPVMQPANAPAAPATVRRGRPSAAAKAALVDVPAEAPAQPAAGPATTTTAMDDDIAAAAAMFG